MKDATPAARRTRFDSAWRFKRGDFPDAAESAFDDSTWRLLDLPHDWAIEGPFDPREHPHTAALPVHGTSWYRKNFTLLPGWRDHRHAVEFDGAMSHARVFLNGREIGRRPYGYISFGLDLDPTLLRDGSNTLAVRLDPPNFASRWYPGAGIYRHVWFVTTHPVAIDRYGVTITTPHISESEATVTTRVSLRNQSPGHADLAIDIVVLDPSGREVAHSAAPLPLPAAARSTATITLTVPEPLCWDIDHPHLYTLSARVRASDNPVDRVDTSFGIRTIGFSPSRGFILNGRHRKIQGVCLHHDLGALGAAVNTRAIERQLELMKAAGVNALRTAHQPPAPEQIQLCDRMGILVFEDTFDVWRTPKTAPYPAPNAYCHDFDTWVETDLRDIIRRDRNHPSLIIWSIGNEVPDQHTDFGGEIARRLAAICKEEDPTRPISASIDHPFKTMENGVWDTLDIKGYNYKPHLFADAISEHPDWIILSSESASTISSRGVYTLPFTTDPRRPDLQASSYDITAPPWAYSPDYEFEIQERFPQVLGQFVWSGIDYLGEPTPYFEGVNDPHWPARSSYYGLTDLAGFPKDRYYLYQSVWTDQPMVHLLPHWNWPDHEDQPIPVLAYTNADEVELFLNDRSLGRQARGSTPFPIPIGEHARDDSPFYEIRGQGCYQSRYRLVWKVPYTPGTLRAVAYCDGQPVASQEVATATVPARLILQPDRTELRADGDDLSFVTTRVEDASGQLHPFADDLVTYQIEGPATLAAVDNGNPASDEPFQGVNHRHAFNGLALAILRTCKNSPGEIRLTATSPGLTSTAVTLRSLACSESGSPVDDSGASCV